MRHKHYAGGRSAATAATAGHAAAAVWNPSAGVRIYLAEAWFCIITAAVGNLALRRITTRGTPGTTITPDLDNSIDRDSVASSGFLLDLAAYSVQPTVDASDLWRWNVPAAVGAGAMFVFPDPIAIPPGTGLALVTPVAVIFPSADITVVVED